MESQIEVLTQLCQELARETDSMEQVGSQKICFENVGTIEVVPNIHRFRIGVHDF